MISTLKMLMFFICFVIGPFLWYTVSGRYFRVNNFDLFILEIRDNILWEEVWPERIYDKSLALQAQIPVLILF